MTGRAFVTVDSRDRESGTPSDYVVRLLHDVRDVCTVKVRSSDIPPLWNVPVGRSSLWVSDAPPAAPEREVVVAPGQHTEDTLAAALEQALDAATALTWTAAFDPTGRLRLSASGPFALRGGDPSPGQNPPDRYGPRAIGRVLGLRPGTQQSDAGGVLAAPHRHQLDRPDNLFLHVEDFDAVHGASSGLHDCLEVINASGTVHDLPAEKHFHPPMSRVGRLRIRIVDYYGLAVDFDNRENRVDLVFSTAGAEGRVGRGFDPSSDGHCRP